MSATNYIPGPHQTVDRAIHPTLGLGSAVYDHGPAFFLSDVGDALQCRSIDMGGVSSSPPRSWLVAYTMTGDRIELETTDLPSGDRHRRVWHSHHGAGWTVLLGREVENAIAMRFDPDEGRPFEMLVHWLAVGTPDYVARMKKRMGKKSSCKSIEMTEEEKNWRTYGLASGETIAFRDSAPPSSEADSAAVPSESVMQVELF